MADSPWLYRILFLNLSARRNISRSPAIFLRTRGTAIRVSREARAGDTTTGLRHRWGHNPINWISGSSFVMGLVWCLISYFLVSTTLGRWSFFLALVTSFSFLSIIPGILGSFQEFLGHQRHWLSWSSFSLLPLCLLEFGDCSLLSVATY